MNALELKIPPLALLVIVATAMYLVAGHGPALAVASAWRTPIACALVASGFGVGLAGILAFRRAQTTVNPTRPGAASSVVRSGVFQVTRNPMYLGMLIALAGWAVWLATLAVWVFLPIFVVYMSRFQIAPEERALAAKFGDDYAAYARGVRRWL